MSEDEIGSEPVSEDEIWSAPVFEDEIGSAPVFEDEIGSAPQLDMRNDMSLPSSVGDHARGDAIVAGIGLVEMVAGGVEIVLDPSAGIADIKHGREKVLFAADDITDAASRDEQAAKHPGQHEPQSTMTETTKDQEERDKAYTKEVERVRESLGEEGPPHKGPYVQREAVKEGTPPLPIFDPAE